MKEPTRGKLAAAPLLGPGAGAGEGTSAAAIAALMEAAAMRTTQETFFMSMTGLETRFFALNNLCFSLYLQA